MKKLPKRKRRKANGKYNGLNPDEQLTPEQACAYAAKRDVHITLNALALLRLSGRGPKYWKIGQSIQYTPQFLDPFIEARLPRVIDPSQRRK